MEREALVPFMHVYAPFSAPAPAPFWMHMRKFLAEGASTRPLLKRSTRLWSSVCGYVGTVSYVCGVAVNIVAGSVQSGPQS